MACRSQDESPGESEGLAHDQPHLLSTSTDLHTQHENIKCKMSAQMSADVKLDDLKDFIGILTVLETKMCRMFLSTLSA